METDLTPTTAENSIIPNDSIKVNMNDRKEARESHLYSSNPTTTATVSAASVGHRRRNVTSSRSPPATVVSSTAAATDESKGTYGFVDKFFAYRSRWCFTVERAVGR